MLTFYYGYTIMYLALRNLRNREVDKAAGCGSVWLECLIWDQEVAGSNPVTPIGRSKYAGVVQW